MVHDRGNATKMRDRRPDLLKRSAASQKRRRPESIASMQWWATARWRLAFNVKDGVTKSKFDNLYGTASSGPPTWFPPPSSPGVRL